MKLSSVLLGVSLLLNLALAGVLAMRPADSTAPAPQVAGAGSKDAPVVRTTVNGPATAPAGAKAWERLKNDDLKALVTNLQRAGFPPAMVRRIIIRVINERFDARRLEIEKDRLATPFWKQLSPTYNDPKVGPQLLALQREELALVKDVLGTNLATLIGDREDEVAMFRYQFGNLPPDKLDPVYNALMDYMEKRMKIYGASAAGGTMLQSDRDALRALDKSMRAEVEKVLTPEQAADFNARMMPDAQQFRYLLAAFKSSETEFKALLPLYENFRDQFPDFDRNLSSEQTAARKAAMDQLAAQASGLVGPSRAAEFAYAMDPMNNQLSRLVARLDLPISAAMEVTAVQQDVMRKVESIRTMPGLTPDQKRAEAVALSTDANTRIAQALGGPRGLEAYKMNGGQWLLSLQPSPRRTK